MIVSRGFLLISLSLIPSRLSLACGGPIGIDCRIPYDNAGIWYRPAQIGVLNGMIAGEIIGGLWEGGDTKLGKTFWQSIDASAANGVSMLLLKESFRRERPLATDNPDLFFQGTNGWSSSFPSSDVSAIASMVSPFIFEYHDEHPSVYFLEALPAWDAMARMKTWGHWPSDVLAGWAIGTAWAYWAYKRPTPLLLSFFPDGVSVGLRYRW